MGPVGYLGRLYMVSGVAALGQIASSPNSITPVLGASGRHCWRAGRISAAAPRAKFVNVVAPLFCLPFVRRAEIVLAVWFVLHLITSPNTGVAWVAHVTRFIAGFLATLEVKPHLASTSGHTTSAAP